MLITPLESCSHDLSTRGRRSCKLTRPGCACVPMKQRAPTGPQQERAHCSESPPQSTNWGGGGTSPAPRILTMLASSCVWNSPSTQRLQDRGTHGPDSGKGLGHPKSVSEAPCPAINSLEFTLAPFSSLPGSSQLLRALMQTICRAACLPSPAAALGLAPAGWEREVSAGKNNKQISCLQSRTQNIFHAF